MADRAKTSSSPSVEKALRVLNVLKALPAGNVVFRQVEQILGDLEQTHAQVERTYAAVVYALLDAYLQHLKPGSPVYIQVKILQQRLQPPLLPGELEGLKEQLELYADHIVQMDQLDVDQLRETLAPLFDPQEQGGAAQSDQAQPQLEDDAFSAADRPTTVRYFYAEPGAGQESGADPRSEHTLARTVHEALSSNEEFGVVLDLVVSELKQADNIQDIKTLRDQLSQQVDRLRDGQRDLGARLDSAYRQLHRMNLDTRAMTEELNRARVQSLTDELTELPNRRAFLRRLEDEVARVQRYKMPLSLAILDLDRFKSINDEHGHQTGDEVLRCYASGVFSLFRHHDMVARYGGEEFAVLLPNTDHDGAQCALRKIRDRATSYSCTSPHSPVPLPSFSAGIAMYNRGETPSAFIERADQALYRAKQLGRNRVEMDGGTLQRSADDGMSEEASGAANHARGASSLQ